VSETVVPYHVTYTPRVLQAYVTLVRSITDPLLVKAILKAGKEFDYRLRIYPQFGEPLRDFSVEGPRQYLGTVPPLVATYVIDEVRREVMVAQPLRLIPKFPDATEPE
jgi:hypothetical protein